MTSTLLALSLLLPSADEVNYPIKTPIIKTACCEQADLNSWNGRPGRQVIFRCKDGHIRGWKYLKDVGLNRSQRCVFWYREGIYYRVIYRSLISTRTPTGQEIKEREILPVSYRNHLFSTMQRY